MLADNVVQLSESQPIIPADKNDKAEKRFCIDVRKVNNISEKDAYSVPHIQEILDKLRFPYPKKANRLPHLPYKNKRVFRFTVMPFRLHSAPTTFQRLLDRVLVPEMEN